MRNLFLALLIFVLIFSCKTEKKIHGIKNLVGSWEMKIEFLQSTCGNPQNGNLTTENWTISEKNGNVFLKIDGVNLQNYKGSLKGNWFDANMMINSRGPNNQLNRSRVSFSLEMKTPRLLEGRRNVQDACRAKFKLVGRKK